MGQISRKDLDKVHDVLHRAERCLLHELQTRVSAQCAFIESLDKLEHALEYIHHWNHSVLVCAMCGGIYFRKVDRGMECLDCDSIGALDFSGQEDACDWKDDGRILPLGAVFSDLQQALSYLEDQAEGNLRICSEYAKSSVQGMCMTLRGPECADVARSVTGRRGRA